MNKYEKINSIYKRDNKGNFTGEISLPEFEYLWANQWYFTEKIDGTNIRVIWDGQNLEFRGRTDKADIPEFLKEKLKQLFSAEDFGAQFGENPACLYGEGYGGKINKGGKYISDNTDFILFDVKVGDWWLKREDVENIAGDFKIKVVPIIGEGTMDEAINLIRKGLKSEFGDFLAEGIVIKPKIELFCRNGKRIITKLKHSDLEVKEDERKF